MTARKASGFTLLELAVFICVMAIVYWAIAPRIGDGMKLAHEQTVLHTAAAFRDSLQALQNLHRVRGTQDAEFNVPGAGDGQLDLSAQGYPLGNDLSPGGSYEVTQEHCLQIWQSLLGPVAPKADVAGDTPFRVQLQYDGDHGLGCHYEYRLAGRMSINYFPESGALLSDARFE